MKEKCRSDTDYNSYKELYEVLWSISATSERIAERLSAIRKAEKKRRRKAIWQMLKSYLLL